MNPDRQRVRIAEACGWKYEWGQISPENDWEGWILYDSNGEEVEFAGRQEELPDYLTDLNVMHEAEATLNDDQYEEFRWTLYTLVRPRENHDVIDPGRLWMRRFVSATAAQRAEAFLKALNLWEEDGKEAPDA